MHTLMRSHVKPASKPSRSNGQTLIEVLVAIAILMLGAGTLAALQLHSLRMLQQSGYQTSATYFAAELAERMRANPAQARADHSTYLFAYQADLSQSQAATPPSSACLLHACDSAAMAAADVSDWQQRLQQALPQARAVVCRDSNPAAPQLRWHCDHADSAAIVIKIGWRPWSATAVPAPGVALAVDL